MPILVQGETIMATEKNTATGSKDGVVTHKIIVKTAFGNFAISLFSNNAVHQAVAKNSGKATFSDKFIAQIQSIEVIVPDEAKAPVDLDSYFD